jgi:hypothetical protein
VPSVSKKQRNFMAAVAHSPAFAKKAGVPQSVGKEFNAADKGKKFGTGGMTRPDVQKVNKPKTQHGKMALFKEGGEMKHADVKMDKKMMQKAVNKHEGRLHKGEPMTKLAKGGMAPSKMGAVKTAAPSINGVATKGKTKGTMVTMKRGGKAC